MSLLKASKLNVGYDKKVIVHDLDFCVNEGDYLCILGSNGAGKSTLMKTIAGLIPKVSGQLDINNFVKRVGYLPQQSIVQKDFPASVYEVVISGCISGLGLRPFFNKKEKETAYMNMKRTGIYELKNKCYRNLSGGQQQRVLLARALCSASGLLMLDEPVNGLDPKAAKDMYELIAGLNKEGVAIIMVSHDVKSALQYPSHILHLGKEHKQLFFGSIKDYENTGYLEKLG
ncbi:zinc transport system ATP-binding protein [Acetitomaculum ruminis DSM 5522]|uniref:Zinc transport system ATP-binding protein n=1 Tax=Acetitomaculum ruminis DSM 5522 TaxID=1120918 RepID=A0A1I0VKD9_9FIRM|nr:ABC transporter ATP-binding protein [Acetitomaculum ruminis]SFA76792.1 zinc transport system ATP-binding protein [Acetitomaculum ruminis DSM 5522]